MWERNLRESRWYEGSSLYNMIEELLPTLIFYDSVSYFAGKKWKLSERMNISFILNVICKSNEEEYIYKKIMLIMLISTW